MAGVGSEMPKAPEFPDVPEVVKSAGKDAGAAGKDAVNKAVDDARKAAAVGEEGIMSYMPKIELPVSARNEVTTLNDVIYWKNPLVTGVLFGTFNIVFFLVFFFGYSFLRVFASAVCMYLMLGLIIVNGSKLLVGFTEKARIPQPEFGREYIQKKVWVPRLESLISHLNKLLDVVISAMYCVDNKRTMQLIGVFYGISLVGRLIPDRVLVYLAGLGIFTIPIVYQTYKEEIDVHLDKLKKLLEEYYKKGEEIARQQAVELQKTINVKAAELKEQVQQKSKPLLEKAYGAAGAAAAAPAKKTE